MSKVLFYLSGGLTILTLISGIILSSTRVSAEETLVSNVSVSVPASCNLSTDSTTDIPHTATINSGTYKDEIGTTTFKVFCNDSGGFSVYAIGYSNQEFGNTKLLATVNNSLTPTYDIITGTNTSGSTSNWAMKLTPVAGTYAPTIESAPNEVGGTNASFSNYHIVPATYTKVATFNSTTDLTSGSAFQSTYAVYVAGNQPAGTYQGKVKYTMVHPASEVPTQPYDTTAGYIGYYPNASGVTDTMGDQSIGSTATFATLWASNFKREGYGFAGWSDKYDWVVNANDANGNGTGANTGYHIYGPNQTINFTAGQYSGTNKGLSLYAVWVKSQGTIQNWNGCNAMNVGQVTALTDTRDGNTYAVAKLRDDANDATSGKCWMIENLRLGGETAMTLTSDTTNIADGTTFTLSASTDPTQTPWCTNNDANCSDQSMLASNNTTNTTTNMTTPSPSGSTGVYGYGNYYNWYSATAGTGTYSTSTTNTSVTSDICPKGWRLARGGSSANAANSDFWQLGLGIMGFAPSNDLNYQNTEINTDGKTAMNAIRSYPNNFIHSGYATGSSFYYRGSYGYFWSSTAGSSYSAYRLYLNSSNLYPGTVGWNKYSGLTARCVVGS